MSKIIDASDQAIRDFGKSTSVFNHDFASSGLFTDEKLAELIERYPREYYMINTMTAQGDKPEWRSGEINWIIDVLGDEKIMQSLYVKLKGDVFKGQTFKVRAQNKEGQRVVTEVKA